MEAGAAAETEPLLPPRSWRAAGGGECVAEAACRSALPRLSAGCFRRRGGFLECRVSGPAWVDLCVLYEEERCGAAAVGS